MNTFIRISFCALVACCLALINGTATAQWSDDFESYTDGQVLDGVGGWGGWDMNPAFAGIASSAQARSGSLSIEIGPGHCDAVHPFMPGEYASGRVEVVVYMYLPSATFAADTYFIVNNAYDGTGFGYFWTTQMHFQISNNEIVCEANGGGGTAPIVLDDWAEIRVVYDLDNDVQLTFYEGSLISTGMVTLDGTQPLEVANIDLFSTGATNYFDDISVDPCAAGDINGDGNVDLLDVTPFVDLLSGGGGYACAADINFDGAVDLLDVTPFVNILSGG